MYFGQDLLAAGAGVGAGGINGREFVYTGTDFTAGEACPYSTNLTRAIHPSVAKNASKA